MNDRLHQVISFFRHWLSASRRGHGIHSPFAYKLCEEVFYNKSSFYDFGRFADLRKDLLKNNTRVEITPLGAGSHTFKGKSRRVGDIASRGISRQFQAELLYRLVNFLQPATMIELGTSIGLTSLYLAAANPKARLYSLEGNSQLLAFARKLATQQHVNNIEFVQGLFKSSLPSVLSRINTLDLIYVDGHHTEAATLAHFDLAMKYRNNDSVFIFDDIYWSREMTEAWRLIREHRQVTLSIDCYYFGCIFFRKEIREKVTLKFLL